MSEVIKQVKTEDGWINVDDIECVHCENTFMSNTDAEWMSRTLDDDGYFCDREGCHFDELRNHVEEVISSEDEFRNVDEKGEEIDEM
tara:strand:+ start:1655 stop:1915 length:261 start_codon:yes stop_codon:yes gene_type:complete